ncbi:MAG: hypothetical protein WC001_13745, partial [Desulfurivibrionaceae bacterium]
MRHANTYQRIMFFKKSKMVPGLELICGKTRGMGKKKPFLLRGRVLQQKKNRRRPTLPPSFPGSTIG